MHSSSAISQIGFLPLPPPDRAQMLQSPPPSDSNSDSDSTFSEEQEQVEDAPYKPSIMPTTLVFESKYLKAPTIRIIKTQE